jgi:hypothetical protein
MAGISEHISDCNTLSNYWAPRNEKFKTWLKLLSMEDTLKQEKMESFVGNDPRSSYNLVLYLLTHRPLPHRVPTNDLEDKDLEKAIAVEDFIHTAWKNIDSNYRNLTGRRSVVSDMVGRLLLTGWSTTCAYITQTECVLEPYNPSTVYPEWGDGLVKCAHIYPISSKALANKAKKKGWDIGNVPNIGNTNLYDYWFVEGADIMHTIFTSKGYLVPPAAEPLMRIPLFIYMTGGLPDDGTISGDDQIYKETAGQSFLAPNEKVFLSYNKQWTFSQQMLRDTAQPRWVEHTRGGAKVAKEEHIFRRGGIFTYGEGEGLEALQVPPMPIELRSDRIDMESMLQRGGPNWALYGNLGAPMTAYVMSQVAASTDQLLSPFKDVIVNSTDDIDNYFVSECMRTGWKPYDISVKMPKGAEVSNEFDIEIPGNIIQKATVSRMLDPEFRLSATTIMDLLWGEVKNPIVEKARIRTDMAEVHPITASINLMEYFRSESTRLRKSDPDAADAYDKAANAIMLSIGPAPQIPSQVQPMQSVPKEELPIGTDSGSPGTGMGRPRMRTEAAPPSMTQAPVATNNQGF